MTGKRNLGKEKCLFITSNDICNQKYGGGQCAHRNYTALQKYVDLTSYRIKKKSNISSMISIINRLFPPISQHDIKQVMKSIEDENISMVFFDGSIFGSIASLMRDKYPNIKIITFFHNVETDYVNVRMGNSIKSQVYKKLAFRSERMSVHNSDVIISLNKRDANRICSQYKRSADYIIPITFEDKFKKPYDETIKSSTKECLIVGSLKRDTYEGVLWFVNNVSPFLNGKTVIVGKGFENKKVELERNNVVVIGSVDDLTPYYLNASCISLPILSGAGMKVKTAEALMYGKTIFGTTEAFEGYEIDYDSVGGLCNSAKEFIEKINNHFKLDQGDFNKNSREYFINNFSFDSSDMIFKKIIDSVFNELENNGR